MTKGRESILGRKSEGKTFEKHSVKFMYSEKAAKIWEIFTLLLTVCTVDKSIGRFRKLLWPAQNI